MGRLRERADLARPGPIAIEIAIGVGVFVVSFLRAPRRWSRSCSVGCPSTTCAATSAASITIRPRWQRVLLKIGKNTLGVLLVLIGIVLSLPGVPGQGLLTILIGVIMLDLPGKQRFERRLMTRPAVFAADQRRPRALRARAAAAAAPRVAQASRGGAADSARGAAAAPSDSGLGSGAAIGERRHRLRAQSGGAALAAFSRVVSRRSWTDISPERPAA